MKANLSFTIELPYLITQYSTLQELSSHREGRQWTFPIKNLDEVLKLIGKPIEFNEEDAAAIQRLSPASKKIVGVEPWKGEGDIQIIELPEVYVVQLPHKREDSEGNITIGKEEHPVNKELVKVVWEVIAKQPINKPVKARTVAENICALLALNRFNRETGTFDWGKFFGSREDYFTFFYYPLKVLQWLRLVEHRHSGHVVRIAEIFEEQSTIRRMSPHTL